MYHKKPTHGLYFFMATNKQRREATRANIISAARECFIKQGFEQTHTNEVLELAGVSRGAMYHHFPSKRDVFEAVYTAVVEQSITHAMQASSDSGSPLEDLIDACHAWLRMVREPEVATILIEQGPQVLGWKRARQIEEKSSLAPMRNAIEKACSAKEISVPSVEITARLINALIGEIALIALYANPRVSVAEQEASVRQFILGLRSR